jgi:uncharacterized protein (DUF697 family)
MIDATIAKARARLEREVLGIEKRTDLTDEQKVSQIIVIFSTVCAAIAIQPIPFADFFILTPLQAYMGVRISAIRRVPLSEKQASDLIKEIMGVVGMGMLAQQIGIGLAKIFFPIFGGIATVPVVFGLTFAIGRVMDLYLVHRAAGRKLSAADIKAAWKRAKADGQKEGERKEEEIKRGGL